MKRTCHALAKMRKAVVIPYYHSEMVNINEGEGFSELEDK